MATDNKKEEEDALKTLAEIMAEGTAAIKASYTPDVKGYVANQPDRALTEWFSPAYAQSLTNPGTQAADVAPTITGDEGLSDYRQSVRNPYMQNPNIQNVVNPMQPNLHALDQGALSYYVYGNPRTPLRRRAFLNNQALQNMINYQIAMEAVTNRRRGM